MIIYKRKYRIKNFIGNFQNINLRKNRKKEEIKFRNKKNNKILRRKIHCSNNKNSIGSNLACSIYLKNL